MPATKPKIEDTASGAAKIDSAVGLSGPLKQPMTVYHTALNLKFVPQTHGFLRGIPHTTENLKLVPGAHELVRGIPHVTENLKFVPGVHTIPMVVAHSAENLKFVPGVHSANIVAAPPIFNTDKSDSVGVSYSGNQMTGVDVGGGIDVGAQTKKVLCGNLVTGVRDLVYCEFEVVNNIFGGADNGVRVGLKDDFYLSGTSSIGWYDSRGNYQGGSGLTTFDDGDIVRMAIALGDMTAIGGPLNLLIWYAVNGGGWEGPGSPNPVTLTDPLITLGVYWPMGLGLMLDPNYDSAAAVAKVLVEPGDLNYSVPSGYTAAGSSSRFQEILRDTDISTLGFNVGSTVSAFLTANFTYRCVIPAAQLSNGPASEVAAYVLHLQTGNKFDEMWIGHKGAGTYDFDGNQVQVKWHNGRGDLYTRITQWLEHWSDTLTFSYDDTKDLVVSFYFSSGGNTQYRRSVAATSGGTARRSGNFAGTTSGAGFSPFGANYIYGLRELAIIS